MNHDPTLPATNTGSTRTPAVDGGCASRLRADQIQLAYDDQIVIDRLDVTIPDGQITAIVGPNACGKSTLLRAMARLLKPMAGQIILDGKQIHSLGTREVARRLGLLPQAPIAPDGILVIDLVARGRTPHQTVFRQWSTNDEQAVRNALEVTDTLDLAERRVDEISGGQRQRVWIAMALAQETELLLLDEPTTFLDISHQLDVLGLIHDLNRERGRTIVAVLHDLNLASRYAHHIIMLRNGAIVEAGHPSDVITDRSVHDVFGLRCAVIDDPISHTPLVIPADNRTHRTNQQTQ